MTETQNPQHPTQGVEPRKTLSLRAKILLGNLIIVLITVAAMGYFVFYRSQAANAFLVEQFDISVSREIENRLNIITSEEVNDIGIFFSSMKNVVETFGATTGAFISDDKTIILEESDWNAYLELGRLPNGSWDNSNTELASIFLPASMTVRNDIAKELAALKSLDYFTQGLLENNPDVIAIYFGGKMGDTVYYPNIDLAAIVPPDFDITSRPWYINAINSGGETAWSEPYLDAALNGLVITSSTSVFDKTGEFRGVAGIDIQLATITDRVSSLSVGKTGYGILIDSDGRAIALPPKGYQDFNITQEEIQSGEIENLSLLKRVSLDVFSILAKMTTGQSGVRLVNINGKNHYISYKPIPIVGYSLGIVVDEEELLKEFVKTNTVLEAETRQTIINAVGAIVILLSVAGLASYGMGNSVTAPLEKLTNIAKKVASGNLDARADVSTDDEIGMLGKTLNSMTSTAQNLIANLEETVAERTEAIERRANQVQAAAEVGQAVAAQRELEELLLRTTHLISNRFGFYHVGIFLLDARREYAVLRAANSSGGARMLDRDHKLRVGVEGIVGAVTGSGEARIALDVGEDAVYFDNPDLPDTRSEMALPLVAGGEVLGALDIQSTDANAFSQDDIPILQVLADQLATAVQNARLLRNTQEALISARRATGEEAQRGWRSVIQNIDTPGYIVRMDGEAIQIRDVLDDRSKNALMKGTPFFSDDRRTINLPIVVRGKAIAMMRLTKPSQVEPWTQDEIEGIDQLSAQISSALESARLYSEAQRGAAKERAISDLTAEIGSSVDIDGILRATAQEIGRTIPGSEVSIRLRSPEIE